MRRAVDSGAFIVGMRGIRCVAVVSAALVAIAGGLVGTATSSEAAIEPTLRPGDASIVEGDMGARTVYFPVTLSHHPGDRVVRVKYEVTGGSATEKIDFKKKSGTLTFARATKQKPATVVQHVAVTVIGDTAAESIENFSVFFSEPKNALLDGFFSLGTIIDDETGSGVRIAVGDVTMGEGDTGDRIVKVPVTLSARAKSAIDVTYEVAGDAADIVPTVGALQFRRNQVTAFVPVVVHSDTLREGFDVASVTVLSASGAAITRAGTLTLVEDDPFISTTLALTSDQNPADIGETVTFTATVTPAAISPNGAPGGFVVFNVDGLQAGGFEPIVGGSASFTTNGLSAGQHNVEALYFDFDGIYDFAQSNVVVQTVEAPAVPGAVFGWGANFANQIGTGDTAPRYDPFQIGTATDYVDLSIDAYHNVAIRSDGTLWVWGHNFTYQLGLGDDDIRHTPTQIGTASDWKMVSAGAYHSIALKDDGSMWGWGENTSGQLGTGAETGSVTTPIQVNDDTDWVDVEAGYNFTLARKADGTLWAWGANYSSQLGLGDTDDRSSPTQVGTATNWASMSSASWFTVATRTDGTLWVWGTNSDGELGLGDNDPRTVPTQLGSGTDWASAHAGTYHAVAIKTDGSLWAWGKNDHGQLGTGDKSSRLAPNQVGTGTDWAEAAGGAFYTNAIKSDGTLWGWGYGSGLLRSDGLDAVAPVQEGTDTHWRGLVAGTEHFKAINTGTGDPT